MRSDKRVTIKDIAEYCGMSKSLVGYILSDSAVRTGSEEARDKVRQAAELLGYRPNRAAKMLVGKSSQIIGVSIDSHSGPAYFRRLSMMEREAKKYGYRLMINENSDRSDELLQSYRTFCEYGVTGVVYLKHDFPLQNEELRGQFAEMKNVVFLGKPIVGDAVYVDVDWRAGTRRAAEYLIKCGRRRVALVVDKLPYYSIETRVDGFREALAATGCREGRVAFVFRIDYSNDLDETRRIVRRAIEELLLPNRIDAICMQNDLFAAFLLQELHRRRIRVPEDIAVIGQDNEPFSGLLIPALATIDENLAIQSKYLIEFLLALIEKKELPPEQRCRRVVPSLVWRESAGVPAGTKVRDEDNQIEIIAESY